MKNRKSLGPDGISNELVEYGGALLTIEVTRLVKKIYSVPEKLRENKIILIFKQNDKQLPQKYREIP